MLKLTALEIQKIFHKKSLYIILAIMTIFCFLNNYLYDKDYNKEGYYKYTKKENIEEEKRQLTKELSKYNDNKEKNITTYLTLKTKLEILELKKQFKQNTWQYNQIEEYLYEIIYQKNMYKYFQNEEDTLSKLEEEYSNKKEQLLKNNWKYFLKLEIKEKETKIKILESQKLTNENIEQELQDLKRNIKFLSYRINNNIKKEKTYLNQAIEELEKSTKIKEELSKKQKLTKEEKITYQDAIAKIKVNTYILKNKKNINKENTTNYELRTISEDYEIFIVILIIVIASTTICEEFIKGTIKLLLIKPYSRVKILLSKYYATIAILILCLLFLIAIELIFGITFLGADSLKQPVVVYHLEKKQLIEYSIFTYMLIRIIARLPFFIMLLNITFTISVIATSTILSITIPMIVYLFESTIKNLIITHHIKWLKYLININWHFEEYLFGKSSAIPNLNKNLSITIWIIYYIVLTILTIRCFKRKDIKNI